jgi:hypothetical protein
LAAPPLEDRAELADDRAGLSRDAPPGEPEHEEAVRGKGGVAAAVGLEGAGRVVQAAAVELDGDALARPQGVDLDQPVGEVDVRVHPREGQAAGPAQREEALLEAWVGVAGVGLVENARQRSRAGSAARGVAQGAGIEEPQDRGLVDGALRARRGSGSRRGRRACGPRR